ncbi:Ppx/GppA phosphatase family protein [Salinibius halmophilus]|uniref:Ppx/GppA phosphatase family protein n=1 Tax=Salinibius halmophilus TaxID=1853216 RepID=UPI001314461A|nr:hypothetical protein [Salinibius halmophilus]
MTKSPRPLFAAMDLGANSFHLALISAEDNNLVTVDVRKALVRMVAGVYHNSHGAHLDGRTKRRVLETLSRFGDFINERQPTAVLAAGTSAFRRLADESFLIEAQTALGHPIKVLSGNEEAEFIYYGASFGRPKQARLVIDIGGGSTEIALGYGDHIETCFSLDLGCISLSNQHLNKNKLSKEEVLAVSQIVGQQIQQQLGTWQPPKGIEVLGASGTIKSVWWALRNLGLGKEYIDRQAIDRLLPLLHQTDHIYHLAHLIDLSDQRTRVFPAGLIILQQIFQHLQLERMEISTSALREGLVAEHLRQHNGIAI